MTSSRPATGLFRLAAAGTAVLLLAGCGSSSDSGADDGSSPSSTSTSAPATSDASSSESSTTSSSSTSATDEAEKEATATLDAPAGGEHKPAIETGEGDAVVAIRHNPPDAPVRVVIVNKGAQDFTAKIQTGSGADATTLHTLAGGTKKPLKLTADAKAIRIESSGHWLVKLLPHD